MPPASPGAQQPPADVKPAETRPHSDLEGPLRPELGHEIAEQPAGLRADLALELVRRPARKLSRPVRYNRSITSAMRASESVVFGAGSAASYNTPMRLLYAVPFWPHLYTPFLSREMAWMRSRGHSVAVISTQPRPDGEVRRDLPRVAPV